MEMELACQSGVFVDTASDQGLKMVWLTIVPSSESRILSSQF